jgi:alkylation response protein AidB-like acyl-CoA dehydrogenase
MDFAWSEDQLAFKKRIVAFAQTLDEGVVERDQSGEFPHAQWKSCAEFGIQSLSIAPPYNATGDETEFMTAVLAMEAMGYGCRDNGLTFALNTLMWTVAHPILQYGTDAQRREFLPGMCAGEIYGAHSLTEPDSGSDVFSLQTHAEESEGGYVLNGHKRYVTFGPIADVVLMFATVDPSLGKWGITAFLVPTKSPGFEARPVTHKMGLRTVPMGDLVLKDVFVPETSRLGKVGAGVSISNSALEVERCCILASQLGAMEYQLERAIAYVRERKQFGQAIGKFQSVSNRIADMKLRLETARLLLYKVAWMKQSGQSAMLEAALLKLHLSECFVESSMDAIRVHGARGYVSEHGVERDLRDAIGGVLYAGTSDIQRMLISRLLGL